MLPKWQLWLVWYVWAHHFRKWPTIFCSMGHFSPPILKKNLKPWCVNICQVIWKILTNEGKFRGFQHLQRDLANVLPLKKTMFDCYYCINSAKHSLKFAENMALYFVLVSQWTFGGTFSLIPVFQGRTICPLSEEVDHYRQAYGQVQTYTISSNRGSYMSANVLLNFFKWGEEKR